MRTLLCLLASALSVLAQAPTTRLVGHWTVDSLGTADGANISSITDSVSGIVASQATTAKQPVMKFNVIGFNGHKVARFNETNATTLDIAAGLAIADKSSYSVFVIGRPGYIDYAGNAVPVAVGTSTQAIWYINNHGQYGYSGDQGDLTVNLNVPSNVSLIGYTSTGSSLIFYNAEASVTGFSFANTGAYTGGHIGSNGVNYFMSGDIAEVLVYSPAILSADLTALRSYVNTTYGTAAARRVIVASGNSITAGDHLLAGERTWPQQFGDMLRSDVRVYNVGFSGQYTTDMIAGTGDAVHAIPLCTSGKDVSFLWEGTNELTIHDAQVSYANMMTLAAQHKAGGCKPIIGTTIKAAQLSGANETNRGTYNALLLAQQLYPVIDLASLSQFSDTTNTTYYYTDGTHLTFAGGTVVANAVYALLQDRGTVATNVGTTQVGIQ